MALAYCVFVIAFLPIILHHFDLALLIKEEAFRKICSILVLTAAQNPLLSPSMGMISSQVTCAMVTLCVNLTITQGAPIKYISRSL